MGQFINALRNAEVRVSPAETLDALRVAEFVGLDQLGLLRESLSLALAKSPEDKARFQQCFERFFSFQPYAEPPTDVPETPLGPAQPMVLATPGALDGGAGGRQTVRAEPEQSPANATLADLLLARDRISLALRFAESARRVGLANMQTLRDKTHMVHAMLAELGGAGLDAEIDLLVADDTEHGEQRLTALRAAKARLQQEVRDFVETQYLLHVDATGQKAVMEAALAARLTQLQPAYYGEMRQIVERIAAKLIAQHARKRKRAKRGSLDIRQTMRRNLAYDGAIFDLRWRRVKIERPKVFALCDVSGSVARVARFMLLLLYHLHDVLPDIRTFAFSSQLGEVTDLFDNQPLERAVEEALFSWGKGTTDYARSLRDFRELCLSDIDRHSTVIILGDGRNNYYDPRPEVLAEISARAKQVLWLNPEPKSQWQEGDAEMARFTPYCFRTATCNSVQDLERFADELLRLR